LTSTAEVYRHVSVPAEPLAGTEIRAAAAAGDVAELGRRLHNRLQSAAEQLCPEIAAWQAWLRELGPAGQLMSGSGSCLFALCRDQREAWRIARGLRDGRRERFPCGPPSRGFVDTIVRSCS
jgi:4-diphosphocytidyl-2-C-methyl-D-erythritol kinase